MGRSPCSRSRWRCARTRMAVGDEDCRRAMNTTLHVTMTNTAICRESAHRSLAVLDIVTGRVPRPFRSVCGCCVYALRKGRGAGSGYETLTIVRMIQRARSATPITA
jgi:hypothetical protein